MILQTTVPRSKHDTVILEAWLQPMTEPGLSGRREGWAMGRTKASSGLSAEEYGRILSFFDQCGPDGPRKVEEKMGIPHKEDKLPQEPVPRQPAPQSSTRCIHALCLIPHAHHIHMLLPPNSPNIILVIISQIQSCPLTYYPPYSMRCSRGVLCSMHTSTVVVNTVNTGNTFNNTVDTVNSTN